ncbi:hypothetical protein KFL_003470060 [Klebsormidium nitens]|uniref:Uncharacterized protein n=1 Tax=Klebsormidium nitens TaxID=105231 RepID=A0A1Y1ID32_KLENI|nr:hypothetical protein KFL_003470060 [Klebsormidium nitens]|eukprot:GAQ87349.1 hypothetical protein KFL_003470060 [Klebsormidium nitens]
MIHCKASSVAQPLAQGATEPAITSALGREVHTISITGNRELRARSSVLPAGKSSLVDGVQLTGSIVEDVLQELFGGGNSSQLFALEFPGRILDETTYKFAVEDAYADMEKPQPVLEAEFALSDGMLDVAEVVGGPNGSKVSEVYEQALNTLMPAFGKNNARFQQDKKAIRSWLLEKVSTQIITINSKTGDVVAQPLTLTRMELYVLLNDRYLTEKLRWQEEKNEKRDEFLAKEGWTRQRALDAWANWVSETAPVRDAKIQARYQDLVAQGLMHEIMTGFSYLDVESSGELLERTKQNMRQSSLSSLDESSVIYPVTFSPVDWAVSLDSNFQPEDLLAQPEALGMKLSGLEPDLDDATNALAMFELTAKPDLKTLKEELEKARPRADNAQAGLIKQYGSATIAIVQMAEFTSAQRALAVSMAQEAEGEVVNVEASKTNLQNKIRQLNGFRAPHQEYDAAADKVSKASEAAKAAATTELEAAKTALNNERNKTLETDPAMKDRVPSLTPEDVPDYTALKTEPEKAEAAKKLTSVFKILRPESAAELTPSKPEGPVSRFMDVKMFFQSDRESTSTLTASSATHTSWSTSFFFGSGGGSSDSASSNFAKDFKAERAKFDLGFRATKVTINRGGWFNPSALKENADVWSMRNSRTRVTASGPTTRVTRPSASLPEKEYNDALALFNANKEAYTTQLEAAQKAMFPAYPVAIVVAKDMTIKIEMDAKTYGDAHSFLESSSTSGGGCFCFSYSKSSSSKSATDSTYSFHDGKNMVIKIPGPQILGWFLEFTGQTANFEFPEYGNGTDANSVESLLPRGNNANGKV